MRQSSFEFKIVDNSDAADFDSVRITLFFAQDRIRGWYISPASAEAISDGYLAKSANLIASSAVIRAIAVAERLRVNVCIIDPENLWHAVWGEDGA